MWLFEVMYVRDEKKKVYDKDVVEEIKGVEWLVANELDEVYQIVKPQIEASGWTLTGILRRDVPIIQVIN